MSETLVERLRRARDKRSLREVARLAGVSRDYPRQLESGEVAAPGIDKVRAIAEALGVRPEWLAFGSGSMTEGRRVAP